MRRKKEYAFEDGTLLIREGGKTNHIRIWPRPHAWYQRCDRSVKTEFAPLYRLIGRAPARRNRGTEENRRQALPFGHGATPKRRAFRLLRSTLPAELADILGEFPGFQWHPAVTLYYHPAARDLLDSNPALAFCLSNNRRFIQLQTQNPGEVDRMLGMRQKEILEWLEFPGSKSMIKIMRKLAPAAVTPRYVSTLRWIMRREEHAARMRHLPRLNAGVLEFFIAPEIRDRAAPRLLEEVAEDPAEDEEGCTARAMLNADRLHRDIHPDETFPVLNERQSVYAFYRRMQEEKGIRIDREREHPWAYGDRAFQPKPKAPIPGTSTIIPLLSERALQYEGNKQHNCVGGFWLDIVLGRSAVYRIKSPERATLELAPDPHGEWHICQLEKACNQPVSRKTREAVKAWLSEHQTGL